MSPSSSLSVAEGTRTGASLPVRYTCFIRLPFSRNGFEDPPPVQWDASKDKALWKIIYKTSHAKDLDWTALSERFGVSLPFLLQQAAWLTERHMEGMRKQMQKLGAGGSGTDSPASPTIEVAGSTSPGGSFVAAKAIGKGKSRSTGKGSAGLMMNAAGQRRLSNLVPQAQNPHPAGLSESPGTSGLARPDLTRTPSTNTIVQTRLGPSSRQPLQRPYRGSSGSQRQPQQMANQAELSADGEDESAIEAEESSDSESEDEPPSMAKSQAFRRNPTSKKPSMVPARDPNDDGDSALDDEDDEGESSGGFLPFAAASKSTPHDPAATIRNSARKQPAIVNAALRKDHSGGLPSGATESSASSASSIPQQHATPKDGKAPSRRPGPLSPEQRAQLTSLSPRYRKEKSDGSPSLGSSFSDLDDLSVTQSALEDALLSMQQQHSISTTMASRVGNFRDVLKRR